MFRKRCDFENAETLRFLFCPPDNLRRFCNFLCKFPAISAKPCRKTWDLPFAIWKRIGFSVIAIFWDAKGTKNPQTQGMSLNILSLVQLSKTCPRRSEYYQIECGFGEYSFERRAHWLLALTQFWRERESSVSSSQPIVCVPKYIGWASCGTASLARNSLSSLSFETVLSKQYSTSFKKRSHQHFFKIFYPLFQNTNT